MFLFLIIFLFDSFKPQPQSLCSTEAPPPPLPFPLLLQLLYPDESLLPLSLQISPSPPKTLELRGEKTWESPSLALLSTAATRPPRLLHRAPRLSASAFSNRLFVISEIEHFKNSTWSQPPLRLPSILTLNSPDSGKLQSIAY